MTDAMKHLFGRFYVLKELMRFLWKERLWWLIPFVLTLIIVALLLVFAQTSPIAPFLYTAF